MTEVSSKLTVSVLYVALFVVSAAIGCGSDDTSAGASAGTGGSSGAGNSAAGSNATAGNGATYSGAECLPKAQQAAPDFPEACLSCACEQGAQAVSACDTACWALIGCAAVKCGDKSEAEAQSCAQTMCGTEINATLASGSLGAITPLSTILRGDTCNAVCTVPTN